MTSATQNTHHTYKTYNIYLYVGAAVVGFSSFLSLNLLLLIASRRISGVVDDTGRATYI